MTFKPMDGVPPELKKKMEDLMGSESLELYAAALDRIHDEFDSESDRCRLTLILTTTMTANAGNMPALDAEEMCILAVASGVEPPEPDPAKAEERFAEWERIWEIAQKMFPSTT